MRTCSLKTRDREPKSGLMIAIKNNHHKCVEVLAKYDTKKNDINSRESFMAGMNSRSMRRTLNEMGCDLKLNEFYELCTLSPPTCIGEHTLHEENKDATITQASLGGIAATREKINQIDNPFDADEVYLHPLKILAPDLSHICQRAYYHNSPGSHPLFVKKLLQMYNGNLIYSRFTYRLANII